MNMTNPHAAHITAQYVANRTNQELAVEALILLCPESMRDTFRPMVEMAINFVPPDSLSQMVTDLQSARDPESGEIDIERLIVIGKQFGLTDQMIDGYKQSFAAQENQPSLDDFLASPPY